MPQPDPLPQLMSCLAGKPPAGIDWAAVLGMANRSLITPTLADRLKEVRGLPDDVSRFLAAVRRRNEERNDRLFIQLGEALNALDGLRIRAVLLKGTAFLATAEVPDRGSRILSDLDLMVRPGETGPAIARLRGFGYAVTSPAGRRSSVTLARSCDVGAIDLHDGFAGSGVEVTFGQLAESASVVRIGQSYALCPSPLLQMLLLVLHDQLKDRDYLRGFIDLRHLIDLQRLSVAAGAFDWAKLQALFPGGHARSALDVQLYTAGRLLGIAVPDRLCGGWIARAQYRRRRIQARWPVLMGLLTLATLLLDSRHLSGGRARLSRTLRQDARQDGWRRAGQRLAGDARRLMRGRILGKAWSG